MQQEKITIKIYYANEMKNKSVTVSDNKERTERKGEDAGPIYN